MKLLDFPVCIDGTRISITAPTREECSYMNRKNFHSITEQTVCDPKMIFEDVV